MSAGRTVKQLRVSLLAYRASNGKEAPEVSAASQQPSVRVGSSTTEQDGGRLAANNKGKSIFDRLLALERDQKAFRQAILAHQQQILANQQQILALEQGRTADQEAHRLEILAIGAMLATHATRTTREEYTDIRSRFLSYYKRRLEFDDEQDRRIIAAGNATALGGHALLDASLYESGVRSDYDTFVRVYGFSYAVVLEIRRFTQFKLNARF